MASVVAQRKAIHVKYDDAKLVWKKIRNYHITGTEAAVFKTRALDKSQTRASRPPSFDVRII